MESPQMIRGRTGLEDSPFSSSWELLESWFFQNEWITTVLIIFLGVIFEILLIKICTAFKKKSVPRKRTRKKRSLASQKKEDNFLEGVRFALKNLSRHHSSSEERADMFSEGITSPLTSEVYACGHRMLLSSGNSWASTYGSEYQGSCFCESSVSSSGETHSSLSFFHSEVKKIFISQRHKKHLKNEYETVQLSTKSLYSMMKSNKKKEVRSSPDLDCPNTSTFTAGNPCFRVAPCPPPLLLSRNQIELPEECVTNQIPLKSKANSLDPRAGRSWAQNRYCEEMVISNQVQGSVLALSDLQSTPQLHIPHPDSGSSQPQIEVTYYIQPPALKGNLNGTQDPFQTQDSDEHQQFFKGATSEPMQNHAASPQIQSNAEMKMFKDLQSTETGEKYFRQQKRQKEEAEHFRVRTSEEHVTREMKEITIGRENTHNEPEVQPQHVWGSSPCLMTDPDLLQVGKMKPSMYKPTGRASTKDPSDSLTMPENSPFDEYLTGATDYGVPFDGNPRETVYYVAEERGDLQRNVPEVEVGSFKIRKIRSGTQNVLRVKHVIPKVKKPTTSLMFCANRPDTPSPRRRLQDRFDVLLRQVLCDEALAHVILCAHSYMCSFPDTKINIKLNVKKPSFIKLMQETSQVKGEEKNLNSLKKEDESGNILGSKLQDGMKMVEPTPPKPVLFSKWDFRLNAHPGKGINTGEELDWPISFREMPEEPIGSLRMNPSHAANVKRSILAQADLQHSEDWETAVLTSGKPLMGDIPRDSNVPNSQDNTREIGCAFTEKGAGLSQDLPAALLRAFNYYMTGLSTSQEKKDRVKFTNRTRAVNLKSGNTKVKPSLSRTFRIAGTSKKSELDFKTKLKKINQVKALVLECLNTLCLFRHAQLKQEQPATRKNIGFFARSGAFYNTEGEVHEPEQKAFPQAAPQHSQYLRSDVYQMKEPLFSCLPQEQPANGQVVQQQKGFPHHAFSPQMHHREVEKLQKTNQIKSHTKFHVGPEMVPPKAENSSHKENMATTAFGGNSKKERDSYLVEKNSEVPTDLQVMFLQSSDSVTGVPVTETGRHDIPADGSHTGEPNSCEAVGPAGLRNDQRVAVPEPLSLSTPNLPESPKKVWNQKDIQRALKPLECSSLTSPEYESESYTFEFLGKKSMMSPKHKTLEAKQPSVLKLLINTGYHTRGHRKKKQCDIKHQMRKTQQHESVGDPLLSGAESPKPQLVMSEPGELSTAQARGSTFSNTMLQKAGPLTEENSELQGNPATILVGSFDLFIPGLSTSQSQVSTVQSPENEISHHKCLTMKKKKPQISQILKISGHFNVKHKKKFEANLRIKIKAMRHDNHVADVFLNPIYFMPDASNVQRQNEFKTEIALGAPRFCHAQLQVESPAESNSDPMDEGIFDFLKEAKLPIGQCGDTKQELPMKTGPFNIQKLAININPKRNPNPAESGGKLLGESSVHRSQVYETNPERVGNTEKPNQVQAGLTGGHSNLEKSHFCAELSKSTGSTNKHGKKKIINFFRENSLYHLLRIGRALPVSEALERQTESLEVPDSSDSPSPSASCLPLAGVDPSTGGIHEKPNSKAPNIEVDKGEINTTIKSSHTSMPILQQTKMEQLNSVWDTFEESSEKRIFSKAREEEKCGQQVLLSTASQTIQPFEFGADQMTQPRPFKSEVPNIVSPKNVTPQKTAIYLLNQEGSLKLGKEFSTEPILFSEVHPLERQNNQFKTTSRKITNPQSFALQKKQEEPHVAGTLWSSPANEPTHPEIIRQRDKAKTTDVKSTTCTSQINPKAKQTSASPLHGYDNRSNINEFGDTIQQQKLSQLVECIAKQLLSSQVKKLPEVKTEDKMKERKHIQEKPLKERQMSWPESVDIASAHENLEGNTREQENDHQSTLMGISQRDMQPPGVGSQQMRQHPDVNLEGLQRKVYHEPISQKDETDNVGLDIPTCRRITEVYSERQDALQQKSSPPKGMWGPDIAHETGLESLSFPLKEPPHLTKTKEPITKQDLKTPALQGKKGLRVTDGPAGSQEQVLDPQLMGPQPNALTEALLRSIFSFILKQPHLGKPKDETKVKDTILKDLTQQAKKISNTDRMPVNTERLLLFIKEWETRRKKIRKNKKNQIAVDTKTRVTPNQVLGYSPTGVQSISTVEKAGIWRPTERTRLNKSMAPSWGQPRQSGQRLSLDSVYIGVFASPEVRSHKDKGGRFFTKHALHPKTLRMKVKRTSVFQLLQIPGCGTWSNRKELRCPIRKGRTRAHSGYIPSSIRECTEIEREGDKPLKPICHLQQLEPKKSQDKRKTSSLTTAENALPSTTRKPAQCVTEPKEHHSVLLGIPPQHGDQVMTSQQVEVPNQINLNNNLERDTHHLIFPQEKEINYTRLDTPKSRSDSEFEFLTVQRVKERVIDILTHSISASQWREGSKEMFNLSSSKGRNKFLTELAALQQRNHKKEEFPKQESISMAELGSTACPHKEAFQLETIEVVAKEGGVYMNRRNISHLLGKEELKKIDALLGSKSQKTLEDLPQTCATQREHTKPGHISKTTPISAPSHKRDPLHIEETEIKPRKEDDSIPGSVSVEPWGNEPSDSTDIPFKSNRKKVEFSKYCRAKQLSIFNQNREKLLEPILSCILHQLHTENTKKQISAKATLNSKVMEPTVEKVNIQGDQPLGMKTLPKPESPFKTDLRHTKTAEQQVKTDAENTMQTQGVLKEMDGAFQHRKKGGKQHHLISSYGDFQKHPSGSQNDASLWPQLVTHTKEALSEALNVLVRTKGLDLSSKAQPSHAQQHRLECIVSLTTPKQMNKRNRTLPLKSWSSKKTKKHVAALPLRRKQSSDRVKAAELMARLGVRQEVGVFKAGQKKQADVYLPKIFLHFLSMCVHLLNEKKRQKSGVGPRELKDITCPGRIDLKLEKLVFPNQFNATVSSHSLKLQWKRKEKTLKKHRKEGPYSATIHEHDAIPLPHFKLDKEIHGVIVSNVRRPKSYISEEEKELMKAAEMERMTDSEIPLDTEKSPLGLPFQQREKPGTLKYCFPSFKTQPSSKVKKVSFSESLNLKGLEQRKKEGSYNVDLKDIVNLICIALKGKDWFYKHCQHAKEPRWKRENVQRKIIEGHERKLDVGGNQCLGSIPPSPHLEWDPQIKEAYTQGITKFCLPSATLQELQGAMGMDEDSTDDILNSIRKAKYKPQKDRWETEEMVCSQRLASRKKKSSVLQELGIDVEEKEGKIPENEESKKLVDSDVTSVSHKEKDCLPQGGEDGVEILPEKILHTKKEGKVDSRDHEPGKMDGKGNQQKELNKEGQQQEESVDEGEEQDIWSQEDIEQGKTNRESQGEEEVGSESKQQKMAGKEQENKYLEGQNRGKARREETEQGNMNPEGRQQGRMERDIKGKQKEEDIEADGGEQVKAGNIKEQEEVEREGRRQRRDVKGQGKMDPEGGLHERASGEGLAQEKVGPAYTERETWRCEGEDQVAVNWNSGKPRETNQECTRKRSVLYMYISTPSSHHSQDRMKGAGVQGTQSPVSLLQPPKLSDVGVTAHPESLGDYGSNDVKPAQEFNSEKRLVREKMITKKPIRYPEGTDSETNQPPLTQVPSSTRHYGTQTEEEETNINQNLGQVWGQMLKRKGDQREVPVAASLPSGKLYNGIEVQKDLLGVTRAYLSPSQNMESSDAEKLKYTVSCSSEIPRDTSITRSITHVEEDKENTFERSITHPKDIAVEAKKSCLTHTLQTKKWPVNVSELSKERQEGGVITTSVFTTSSFVSRLDTIKEGEAGPTPSHVPSSMLQESLSIGLMTSTSTEATVSHADRRGTQHPPTNDNEVQASVIGDVMPPTVPDLQAKTSEPPQELGIHESGSVSMSKTPQWSWKENVGQKQEGTRDPNVDLTKANHFTPSPSLHGWSQNKTSLSLGEGTIGCAGSSEGITSHNGVRTANQQGLCEETKGSMKRENVEDGELKSLKVGMSSQDRSVQRWSVIEHREEVKTHRCLQCSPPFLKVNTGVARKKGTLERKTFSFLPPKMQGSSKSERKAHTKSPNSSLLSKKKGPVQSRTKGKEKAAPRTFVKDIKNPKLMDPKMKKSPHSSRMEELQRKHRQRKHMDLTDATTRQLKSPDADRTCSRMTNEFSTDRKKGKDTPQQEQKSNDDLMGMSNILDPKDMYLNAKTPFVLSTHNFSDHQLKTEVQEKKMEKGWSETAVRQAGLPPAQSLTPSLSVCSEAKEESTPTGTRISICTASCQESSDSSGDVHIELNTGGVVLCLQNGKHMLEKTAMDGTQRIKITMVPNYQETKTQEDGSSMALTQCPPSTLSILDKKRELYDTEIMLSKSALQRMPSGGETVPTESIVGDITNDVKKLVPAKEEVDRKGTIDMRGNDMKSPPPCKLYRTELYVDIKGNKKKEREGQGEPQGIDIKQIYTGKPPPTEVKVDERIPNDKESETSSQVKISALADVKKISDTDAVSGDVRERKYETPPKEKAVNMTIGVCGKKSKTLPISQILTSKKFVLNMKVRGQSLDGDRGESSMLLTRTFVSIPPTSPFPTASQSTEEKDTAEIAGTSGPQQQLQKSSFAQVITVDGDREGTVTEAEDHMFLRESEQLWTSMSMIRTQSRSEHLQVKSERHSSSQGDHIHFTQIGIIRSENKLKMQPEKHEKEHFTTFYSYPSTEATTTRSQKKETEITDTLNHNVSSKLLLPLPRKTSKETFVTVDTPVISKQFSATEIDAYQSKSSSKLSEESLGSGRFDKPKNVKSNSSTINKLYSPKILTPQKDQMCVKISITKPSNPENAEERDIIMKKQVCLSKHWEKSPCACEVRDTLTVLKGERNCGNTASQEPQPSVVEMSKLPHVQSEKNFKSGVNEINITLQTRRRPVPRHDDFEIIKVPDMSLVEQGEEGIMIPSEQSSLVVGECPPGTQLFHTRECSLLPKQRDYAGRDINTRNIQKQETNPDTEPTAPQVKINESKILVECFFPIYESLKAIFEDPVENVIQGRFPSDRLGKVQAYKPDDDESPPLAEDPDTPSRRSLTLQWKPIFKHITPEEKIKLNNHLASKIIEIKLNMIPEMAKISLQKLNSCSNRAVSEGNSWRLYPRHKEMNCMSPGVKEHNLKYSYLKDSPSRKVLTAGVSSGNMEVMTERERVERLESDMSTVISAGEHLQLALILQTYSVEKQDKLLMHLSRKTLEIQSETFSRIVRGSFAMANAQDTSKPLPKCIHSAVKAPKRRNRILLLFDKKSLHQIDLNLREKCLHSVPGFSTNNMVPMQNALPSPTLKLSTVSSCKKEDDSWENCTLPMDKELVHQPVSFQKENLHKSSLLFRKVLEPSQGHTLDPGQQGMEQRDTRGLAKVKSHMTPKTSHTCHKLLQETNAWKPSELSTQQNAASLPGSHSAPIPKDFIDIDIKRTETSSNCSTPEGSDSEESVFVPTNCYLNQESENIFLEAGEDIPLENLRKKEAAYLKAFYHEGSGAHQVRAHNNVTMSSCDSSRSRSYSSSCKMQPSELVCHSSSSTMEIETMASSIRYSKEKHSWSSHSKTSFSFTSLSESSANFHRGKEDGRKPHHRHPESKDIKKTRFDLLKNSSVHWDTDYSHAHREERHTRKKKVCYYESKRSYYSPSKHPSASSEERAKQPFVYACIPADSHQIAPQTIRWAIPQESLSKKNFQVPLVAKISNSTDTRKSYKK